MDRQEKDEYTFWKKTFMLRLWLIRSMRHIYKNRGTRSDHLQFEGGRKVIKQYMQRTKLRTQYRKAVRFLGSVKNSIECTVWSTQLIFYEINICSN